MATTRVAGPSITNIYQYITKPSRASRCAQCLRAQRCPFSSFAPRLQANKRPLMTESAYRPQTLDPEMQTPPKNAGTPETSISKGSGQQQTSQTWPPQTPWQRHSVGKGVVSEREGEAQQSRSTIAGAAQQQKVVDEQSKVTGATAPPSPTITAKPAKKTSKLRPRKAPIKLTPKAVEQLQMLFEQPESKMIRVGVKNRGCSGLAYHLEYVDKPGSFDETVEQDGVKVLIDSKALFSIIGSEMDWLEDKLSARFIFRNPNITEQCGCGESFSIS